MRLYALSERRHEALLQYEVLRETLSGDLDTEPGANTQRLYEEIQAGSFPATPSPSAATNRPSEEPADSSSRHNLPSFMSSFVGREREIPEVMRTLSMTQLLTLIGAGGSGKTRLALETARGLFCDLRDVRSVAVCLVVLGLILLSQGQGNSEWAAVLFEESLLPRNELTKTAIVLGLAGMARVSALQGQLTHAAKLFGASEALREEIGLSRAPLSFFYEGEGCLATVRAGLEKVAFEAAWSEGQAMTPDEAVEYALSKEEEREPPTPIPLPQQQVPARSGGPRRARANQPPDRLRALDLRAHGGKPRL
jgi:hypothetical protein